LAGREPADRDERSAEAGAARTGRTEGLIASSLTRTLAQLASLAAIRGDAAEESLLARAADLAVAHHIESDADLEPLFVSPPPDADAAALTRLRQMYEAGGWVLVESAVADLPTDLRWLYESDAVTLEQLAALQRALDITSAADLTAAVREQRIRDVAELGEAVEQRVAAAVPLLRGHVPRVPLGRATTLTTPVLATLRAQPDVLWAEPTGSLRRGQDLVGDIEVLAAAEHPAPAIEAVIELPDVSRILHRSARRAYVLVDRTQIGVRVPEPSAAGAAQLYLTGSPAHFEALRARAQQRGLTLTASGLVEPGGTQLAATEDEIYRALDLPTIPPEIRQGDREIAVAASGELPRLLERADIRGDLHMHSVWSDGRDSIEAMVGACRALGYEYVAITDHSEHSAATRNLSADGVQKQAEEIAALRERFGDIAILHGCEVDILPDGRLDFPDRVLERFDIVLASLHEGAGQGPDQLLKRYAAALHHPLVALITHPTNRLVPSRAGYDLDYDRLFALAAETGTAVEVDGAPAHLDLDGTLARRAIEAGATLVVNSDCHRADMLERQMTFGVTTARRGWVEPRHVLNTRPLSAVRAAIAAKRRGR
jgi:DNA polymerase (family X)